MADRQWVCVRQRSGPLVKECRALCPHRSHRDDAYDRTEKNRIIRGHKSAVFGNSVDRMEVLMGLFGWDGIHYTLTFDPFHLPDSFDLVKTRHDALIRRAEYRLGYKPDYIRCIEGIHGDHRYHIHLILRMSQCPPELIRRLWKEGAVKDKPLLERKGGYRRMASYLHKEHANGKELPLNKHLWTCSKGLRSQLPLPERGASEDGFIDIPDNIIWSHRHSCENEFGQYNYASYILAERN